MFKIPKETESIRSVRSNVEELLMVTIQECWKENISAYETYKYLNEIIDWFEAVGIYEEGELRNIIINKIGESINAKIKEINK